MTDSTSDATEQAPKSLRARAANGAAAALVLLIFLTPVVGFIWLKSTSRAVARRSALDHTRGMLVRHFVRTRGKWPRSWDDLTEDFEPEDAGYTMPSLDALKQEVQIDFTFDPNALFSEEDASAPRLVWLQDDADAAEAVEANERLVAALRKRREYADRRGQRVENGP